MFFSLLFFLSSCKVVRGPHHSLCCVGYPDKTHFFIHLFIHVCVQLFIHSFCKDPLSAWHCAGLRVYNAGKGVSAPIEITELNIEKEISGSFTIGLHTSHFDGTGSSLLIEKWWMSKENRTQIISVADSKIYNTNWIAKDKSNSPVAYPCHQSAPTKVSEGETKEVLRYWHCFPVNTEKLLEYNNWHWIIGIISLPLQVN